VRTIETAPLAMGARVAQAVFERVLAPPSSADVFAPLAARMLCKYVLFDSEERASAMLALNVEDEHERKFVAEIDKKDRQTLSFGQPSTNIKIQNAELLARVKRQRRNAGLRSFALDALGTSFDLLVVFVEDHGAAFDDDSTLALGLHLFAVVSICTNLAAARSRQLSWSKFCATLDQKFKSEDTKRAKRERNQVALDYARHEHALEDDAASIAVYAARGLFGVVVFLLLASRKETSSFVLVVSLMLK